MQFAIGKYDISISMSAKWKWTNFMRSRGDNYRHYCWGRLSIHIEDGDMLVHRICLECFSEGHAPEVIETTGAGDELWDICPACRSIEGRTKDISNRELQVLLYI